MGEPWKDHKSTNESSEVPMEAHYGSAMEPPCYNGSTMEAPMKSTIDVPTETPRNDHASTMEPPWKHYDSTRGSTGVPMVTPRKQHGSTIVPAEATRKHRGNTMEVPWKHHNVSLFAFMKVDGKSIRSPH